MLSLLAVAMIALMGLSPARQAWLINAWSLQYTRHALIPTPSRATWKCLVGENTRRIIISRHGIIVIRNSTGKDV